MPRSLPQLPYRSSQCCVKTGWAQPTGLSGTVLYTLRKGAVHAVGDPLQKVWAICNAYSWSRTYVASSTAGQLTMFCHCCDHPSKVDEPSPSQNWVWVSKLDNATCSPREYENVYYLGLRSPGREGQAPEAGPK